MDDAGMEGVDTLEDQEGKLKEKLGVIHVCCMSSCLCKTGVRYLWGTASAKVHYIHSFIHSFITLPYRTLGESDTPRRADKR